MTATEELRRMLDERGVEWWDMSDEYEWYTEWVPEMLVKYHHRHRAELVGFFESTWRKHGEMANGLVLFGNKHHRHCIYDLTPEQAIAATLGAGEYRKPTMLSQLEAENAKLRELVKEAVDAASLKDMRDWRYGKRLAFLREARELGVEVDG